MLLGASATEHDLDVDLAVVVDHTTSGDAGIPQGAALLAFASAVTAGRGDLAACRSALLAAVGEAALIEAAATVAIFHGLVRVADGTGIQLDPTMLTSTEALRSKLDIDSFAGAANSIGAPTNPRRTSAERVKALFD